MDESIYNSNEHNIKMEESSCIIKSLLERNFLMRTLQEQIEIVSSERPCPDMPELTQEHEDKRHKYTRHFSGNSYSKLQWLAGSEELNKVFCWPCLLFDTDKKTAWSTDGFDNLNSWTITVSKHEKSQNHIKSSMSLCMFRYKYLKEAKTDDDNSEVSERNEIVKKNRDTLRRLIDGLAFLSSKGIFLFDDTNLDSLKMLNEYDPIMLSCLSSVSVSMPFSEIVKNVYTAFNSLIMDAVKEEVGQVEFVIIVINNHSEMSEILKLSTFLRFVNEKGLIEERFADYTVASFSDDFILNHLHNVIEMYNLGDKFMGFSYNGHIMYNEAYEALNKITQAFPKQIFCNDVSRHINYTLIQSISRIPKCRLFFDQIRTLSKFFGNEDRYRGHDDLNMFKKWDCSWKYLNSVQSNWARLIEFFRSKKNNPWGCDCETLILSDYLYSVFKSIDFIFFLGIFDNFFKITDELQSELVQKIFSFHRDYSIIATKLQLLRTESMHFELFWDCAILRFSGLGTETAANVKIKLMCNRIENEKIFRDIVYSFRIEIDSRYNKKLSFVDLLCPETCNNIQRFPDEILTLFRKDHNNHFDIGKLKTELLILYSLEQYRYQNLYDLSRFLVETKLNQTFVESTRLLSLILSLPVIRSFNRSFDKVEECNGKNVISLKMERDLFVKLQRNVNFGDDIISKFILQTQNPDFIFVCSNLKVEPNLRM